MVPLENTRTRYGALTMLLHWSMALLVIGLAALGLYMARLPDAGFDTHKPTLILVHKELGLAALVLLAVRWPWRLVNRLPELPAQQPQWQQVVARLLQLCFYALLLALPVSGWLMSSASGIPVSFFGLFRLPDLVVRNDDQFALLDTIHKCLGYTLIACLALHVGAALRHHFGLRDDTLRKMLP